MRIFAPLFLLAAATLALGAHAESVDETRPLAATGRVAIANVAGSIQVRSWDRNEVRVTGDLDSGDQKLEITGGASDLRIEVKAPRRGDHGSADLDVRVPMSASVTVEAVSADVTSQDLKGALKVSAVSGDVTVSVSSPELSVDTVSGDVRIDAPSSNTRVQTVSGDVTAKGLRGVARFETVSGDVQVAGAGAFTQLGLKTVSGDARFNGELAPEAKVDGQTLSGSLELKINDLASVQTTLHSFSGDIHSDFGATKAGKSEHDLEGKVGDGKAKISLSSFSGDIELSKR